MKSTVKDESTSIKEEKRKHKRTSIRRIILKKKKKYLSILHALVLSTGSTIHNIKY